MQPLNRRPPPLQAPRRGLTGAVMGAAKGAVLGAARGAAMGVSGDAPQTQAPRRHDPAPSYWDYKMQRLWLTPLFRVLFRVGLPVLAGERVVAVLDLKTDRAAGKLLMQQWTWLDGCETSALKAAVEEELQRFERFQLALDEAVAEPVPEITKMSA